MMHIKELIPAGYMYKLAGAPQADFTGKNIDYVYSAGICGGSHYPYFADYIQFWKHNGYWWFDSPQIIEEIAIQNKIDLSPFTLFYYEFYAYQFNYVNSETKMTQWSKVAPDLSFSTNVAAPFVRKLAGYDIVEYYYENAPGCSLLSCSGLAERFSVNRYCLFETLAESKAAMESTVFLETEPGPYRIIAVYTVDKQA